MRRSIPHDFGAPVLSSRDSHKGNGVTAPIGVTFVIAGAVAGTLSLVILALRRRGLLKSDGPDLHHNVVLAVGVLVSLTGVAMLREWIPESAAVVVGVLLAGAIAAMSKRRRTR